jgi:hypothetical protein
MILRRVTQHVCEQNWTAVALDFVTVVVGVFLGIQIGNWNAERIEAQRRGQIIDALVTNLNEAISVQERFVAEIRSGLSEWEKAYERGETPPPFFYRIEGSDIAPDTWSTFEQMQVADFFDPVTLFDLTYFSRNWQGSARSTFGTSPS